MVPASERELGVRLLAILCQEGGAWNYLWADLAWREALLFQYFCLASRGRGA